MASAVQVCVVPSGDVTTGTTCHVNFASPLPLTVAAAFSLLTPDVMVPPLAVQ